MERAMEDADADEDVEAAERRMKKELSGEGSIYAAGMGFSVTALDIDPSVVSRLCGGDGAGGPPFFLRR